MNNGGKTPRADAGMDGRRGAAQQFDGRAQDTSTIAEANSEEALALLARIPESDRTRHVAALARVGQAPQDDYDEQLTALLDQVKTDDDARQKYVDLLELMGPADPRTADYRRQLTSRLY